MELWKENAQVSSSFNDLLNKWLLFLKIGLQVKDASYTAVCGPSFTSTPRTILCLLAMHHQPILPQSSFKKNLFHPLQLAREFRVIHGKAHQLLGLLSIFHIPPILKRCLFTTGSHIHAWCKECIFSICWMALWVVNHDECLVFRTMCFLESWNNPLPKLYFLISNQWSLRDPFIRTNHTCFTKSLPFQ